jgi:hypothetical protein
VNHERVEAQLIIAAVSPNQRDSRGGSRVYSPSLRAERPDLGAHVIENTLIEIDTGADFLRDLS